MQGEISLGKKARPCFTPDNNSRARMATLGAWPRGVTVSALDSESSDPGSNPREAFQESAGVFCVSEVQERFL